jgi:hypothetical protein
MILIYSMVLLGLLIRIGIETILKEISFFLNVE